MDPASSANENHSCSHIKSTKGDPRKAGSITQYPSSVPSMSGLYQAFKMIETNPSVNRDSKSTASPIPTAKYAGFLVTSLNPRRKTEITFLLGIFVGCLWSVANMGSNKHLGSPSRTTTADQGPGSVAQRAELYRNFKRHLISKAKTFFAWLRWEETESLGKSLANHDAECQTECKGCHNARKHVAMTHRGVLPAESVSCRSPLKVTGSQKPFNDCQL